MDITGLSQAVTVNDSRRIRITAFCRAWESTVGTDRAELHIREGSTTLNFTTSTGVSNNTANYGIMLQVVLTPSSGSHTYKASFARSSGTGTLTFHASSTGPSFLLIEDIGPSS